MAKTTRRPVARAAPLAAAGLCALLGASGCAAARVPTAGGPRPVAAEPAASLQERALAGPQDGFVPLDIPDWVIHEDPARATDLPWILVLDDPQCPYCAQLHLALEKAREQADPEISRAVVALLPFPLAFHDQAVHIVSDAFCLEETRVGRPWSAASYMRWLIVEPWKAEPGWSGATIGSLGEDGGFFDSNYEAHRVTSSRRRDYQTAFAKADSSCEPGACGRDADCETLCSAQSDCRAACPEPAAGAADPSAAAGGRGKCLDGCAAKFVSARYRQFSKAHMACLMSEGPRSAHGRTAAAYAWALAHKVPGTPTVLVGHPSIGFRTLGDSDELADFIALLRGALAEARGMLQSAPKAP